MTALRLIKKIVSGGQTGVDRAALDVAIGLRIPHGGFCPKGRRSESGRIPGEYTLDESESENYIVRTKLNVEHSDGTLVITKGQPDGGTLNTIKLATAHGKPVFAIDLSTNFFADEFLQWVSGNGIAVLNVAGPRESKHPGIYEEARSALNILFAN